MSKKLCISTVCTNDDYSYYLPLFAYSANKAYPDYSVIVYVTGEMKKDVRSLLDYVGAKCEIKENAFEEYPKNRWAQSALRHLVPEEDFKGFDHLFVCDIDFIFVKQAMSILDYFGTIIKDVGEPYAAFRGHTNKKWDGSRKRLCEGLLMLKLPEWFEKTEQARNYYRKHLLEKRSDSFDSTKPATYREFGEVMLYRICKTAKLRTPSLPWCFINGNFIDMKYRQIHLGDFKFPGRYNNMVAMTRYLPLDNIVSYQELYGSDEKWKRLVSKIQHRNKAVGKAIKQAQDHMKKRLKIGA